MIQRLLSQPASKADITQLCRVFQLSRSGLHAARRRQQQPVKLCPQGIQLKAVFEASGRNYGSRRLMQALRQQGHRIGRYRVRRLMRHNGLQARWRRKFVHTTDSRHDLPVAPNILNRQFEAAAPDRAWVGDITYIRTRTGWLYLAVVIDLYLRRVVGWAMEDHMQASLVCDAMRIALATRRPPEGLLMHSDRGSQYASHEHVRLLQQHGITQSMSRKGQCWDNAVAERFFLNLKMERVWQRDYANQAEARQDIADYIVNFYNPCRLHASLGYRSPAQFEQAFHHSLSSTSLA